MTTTEWIWLDDQPLAVVVDAATASPRLLWIHGDQLGTPQKLTDQAQAVLWDGITEPFGALASLVTGLVDQPLRLPGQYAEPLTGLHQNWHRDYDPDLGRYLQPDPIGIAGGSNLYAYTNGNPVTYSDPDGRIPAPLVVLGGIWLAYEWGAFAADTAATLDTLTDRCASWQSKGLSTGLWLLGALGPGGGYSAGLRSLDDLSAAARALDRNGFTRAGRSLQKHHRRQGTAYGSGAKSAADFNREAHDLVDDILTAPGSKISTNARGGIDVEAAGGRIVRFNRDGSFQGFREP